MRKFLFDVILGMVVGIGALIAGIAFIFNKLMTIYEIKDRTVDYVKDTIYFLLYGAYPSYKDNPRYTVRKTVRKPYGTHYYSTTHKWTQDSKQDEEEECGYAD